MKYFSMFSGIGGFDLALNRQGHECIGYSEIDKYAIQIYEKNFGKEVKNYGDARKINPDELPDFDFLCGGFPCQSFSIAGNRKGFDDTRGTLFFEIARILKTKRPKNFLLENVKGLLNHYKGKTFATIIQTLDELGYDFEWMVLNSKFFGVPQNRERVFIIGSLRGTSRPEILPIRTINKENIKESEKSVSATITSRYWKQGNSDPYIIHPAITGALGRQGSSSEYLNSLKYIQRARAQHSRIYDTNGISPTLAGASKLSGDCTPKIAIPILTPNRENKRQNGRRFKENGDPSFTLTGQDIHGVMISPTLHGFEHGTNGNFNNHLRKIGMIRRLTPKECERLQGFPDNFTEGISDTQRYKVLGNAVTVNVIEEIIINLQKTI